MVVGDNIAPKAKKIINQIINNYIFKYFGPFLRSSVMTMTSGSATDLKGARKLRNNFLEIKSYKYLLYLLIINNGNK